MARKKLFAYTLLEIVVILGVFSGLALVFLPVGIEQLQSNKIENVVKDVQSLIYSQSQSAYAFKDNKSYGIACKKWIWNDVSQCPKKCPLIPKITKPKKKIIPKCPKKKKIPKCPKKDDICLCD